jgi:hypothetical protein
MQLSHWNTNIFYVLLEQILEKHRNQNYKYIILKITASMDVTPYSLVECYKLNLMVSVYLTTLHHIPQNSNFQSLNQRNLNHKYLNFS